jgi:hypothetical protein
MVNLYSARIYNTKIYQVKKGIIKLPFEFHLARKCSTSPFIKCDLELYAMAHVPCRIPETCIKPCD